jgi:hypothetical protein
VTVNLGKAMKLQFITANTLQEVHDVIDWDNSQYDLVTDVDQNRLRVFSQEIQLSGGTDKIKWVGGAYYWDQTNRSRATRYQLEEFVRRSFRLAGPGYAERVCLVRRSDHQPHEDDRSYGGSAPPQAERR